YLISEFVAPNYIGLVQIKNFGTFRQLFREICLLVELRPVNLMNPVFWMFSLGTILVPGFLLLKAVNLYKKLINPLMLKDLKCVQTGA
ncbi:MAG TPA: hypothetical protein PLU24_03120, partial [Candidatus Omnitrophota bacterium]|nr:hypothetical protein [Candidatus Omnitrophota bacterium]